MAENPKSPRPGLPRVEDVVFVTRPTTEAGRGPGSPNAVRIGDHVYVQEGYGQDPKSLHEIREVNVQSTVSQSEGPTLRPPRMPEGEGKRKPAVRLEVRRFSLLMELKLRKNDHKGGWSDVTPARLLQLLEGEVRELREAIESGDPLDIAQEAADVANYAMMIADVTEGI